MKKYTTVLSLLLAMTGCTSSHQDTSEAMLTEKDGYVLSKGERAVAKNHRIRFLVLHYTALDQAQSVETLTRSEHVSANYLIPDRP
jgi:N-acetylmuramoyl-L-alanine amidase